MRIFWRSVLTVLTGTALSQLIPIFGALLLARLYAPSEFGTFSAWLGIVLIVAVFLTARYETVLPNLKDGAEREGPVLFILSTGVLVAAISCLTIGGIVISWPTVLQEATKELYFFAIPAALCVSVSLLWQTWAAAAGEYRILSLMRIYQAAGITFAQIALGFLHPNATSLGVAYLIGSSIGVLASFKLMPIRVLSFKKIICNLPVFWMQYRRFPIYSLPASAINTAAAQLPVIVITSRFGPEVGGLLAMSMRILGAPIGLLGKSVQDVFKRQAATAVRERGECRKEYMNTLMVLSSASIAFVVLMALYSENLFSLAFGDQWREAGIISIWLLPLFAMRFIASPLSYVVYVVEKQHVDLIWQVGLMLMTLATLYWGPAHDVALKAYSLGYAALYVVYLIMSYRFSLGVRFK